jgi:hypothetical protein
LVIALRVLAGTLTWPHGGLAALLRLHFPGGLYYYSVGYTSVRTMTRLLSATAG